MDLGLREDEEFARKAFAQHLESKGVSKQNWSKGGGRRLPPDCYLKVDNEEFVIEITTLLEQVLTPRRSISIAAMIKSAIYFVHDVEVAAKNLGILSGTYYVFFSDQDFHAMRKRLQQEILAFIQVSHNIEEVSDRAILLRGRTYCWVTKTTGKGNEVKLGSPPEYAVNLEGQYRVAKELLQDALIKKRDKLNEFGRPKILILQNCVSFVDSRIYQQHIDLDHIEDYHTVFIVGNENYVLSSVNPDWA